MGYAPERSERRGNCPLCRADRAIAPGLFTGNSRRNTDFLPVRDFAHALDFSSLRRYNDAIANGEPFRRPPASKEREGKLWIRNSSS